METLLIAVGAAVLYLVAYHTYGRWLARKVFKLDPEAVVPSVAQRDDKDYVPTKKSIIFGHHFTSIAGTGPIVGPALAVIWGWVPALLWVLFGSIFIGAVHDFGSLVVSLRNRGQTVGDIAGRVLSKRARLLFLLCLFVALTIVLAIFGLVIAAVFRQYPASIFPCIVQIPLAVGIGYFLHRRGVSIVVPSLIALALMLVSVYFGNVGFLGAFNATLAGWSFMTWVMVLLGYSYVASVLPVWVLLAPRDYINSLQLLTTLALVVIGLVVASFVGGAPVGEGGERPSLELIAPAFRWDPAGAPAIFPFLFITIACGAISGFHCLVSSGTSSKQIERETDSQFVGFGSMLTEGFLAVLVILACVAGIGLGIAGGDGGTVVGQAAYELRYASWDGAHSLAAKVGAFVEGAGNFLKAIGIDPGFAIALMGVFVASFAATTLDTACRLQRYVVQELAGTFVRRDGGGGCNPLKWLTNKHGATIFAVILAAGIASLPAAEGKPAGTGGQLLWPLFGATNQLLAGLAFLVVAFWMRRRGLPVWFVVLPMWFMLALPGVAMAMQVFVGDASFLARGNWLLTGIGVATLVLQGWVIVEAAVAWPKVLEAGELSDDGGGSREIRNEGGRSC